jgi:hypothetical protein
VNVQEYISSGIVENYVMGLADETESAEFERMCELYPEVKAAREAYELALEETAMMNAIEPPRHIKSKVFSEIEIESEQQATALQSTISSPTAERKPAIDFPRKLKIHQYITAASLLLFIISSILAIYYSRRSSEAEQQYQLCLASEKEIQTTLAVLQSERDDLRNDLHLVTNEDMVQVKLPAATVPASPAPESMVTVFWNKRTKALFLVPNKMPKPAANKQYQLWALVDGKPRDAGVFDMNTNELVITMKRTETADAFAVSLEEKGAAHTTPSGEIYVMGKI